ncbi:hypothetical protein C0Q70_16729 [Pomacea canaliculata]|uniref:Uncharacterized protein n=1 Tax=Pomacea canaliculata TaxID=400727 RepID=A0A2T7NQK5_POMCA|nr:hypothetical protein C0Q70_16729 [Pomacea canaliculata]
MKTAIEHEPARHRALFFLRTCDPDVSGRCFGPFVSCGEVWEVGCWRGRGGYATRVQLATRDQSERSKGHRRRVRGDVAKFGGAESPRTDIHPLSNPNFLTWSWFPLSARMRVAGRAGGRGSDLTAHALCHMRQPARAALSQSASAMGRWGTRLHARGGDMSFDGLPSW